MNGAEAPLLALDSSTRAAYVALWAGGRIAASQTVAAAANASSALLPAVDAALRGAGLAPADVGALVVGGGPGSFTGLRIAAATAKGMVHALRVPLFAYSGLMAAAAAQGVFGVPVCALFDARNREVFAGAWRLGQDGAVEDVLSISPLRVDELPERFGGGPVRFCGEGAVQYAEELRAAFGPDAVLGDDASLAAGLLWLARHVPERGRVADAAAWEPDYVRAAGVERIAAARAG